MAKQVDENIPESRRLKVKLKATSGHPHIAAGTTFEVHPSQEKQLKERGWAVPEKDDHNKVKKEDMAVPLNHSSGKPGTGDQEETPAKEEAPAKDNKK